MKQIAILVLTSALVTGLLAGCAEPAPETLDVNENQVDTSGPGRGSAPTPTRGIDD